MAKGIFGERLKRERELREVTLEEITAATRIGPRFLEALENEDWDKLPGGVFNRGFVRSVAHYLGLDEEAFLAEYDLAHGAQLQPTNEHHENRIPSPPKWLPVAMLLGILVILAGFVIGALYAWRHYTARRAAKQATVFAVQTSERPASAPSVPAAPDSPQLLKLTPSAATEPPLDLFISVSAPTHVRVQADGKLLLEADLPAGESHHFTARDHFDVTAADSSAVLLELNGQAMPPLGAPGASGTMTYGRKDLRQRPDGNSQP